MSPEAKVLAELVELKDIRRRIDNGGMPVDEYHHLVDEYARRKPLAWEAAREVLAAIAVAETRPPDDPSRCAICAWPLASSADLGCVRGDCSFRPRPETLYAPERAAAEAAAVRAGP